MQTIKESLIRVDEEDYAIDVTTQLMTEEYGIRLATASAHLFGGESGIWWVSRVLVPESWRRRGVGGQLLERLKQAAQQREGFLQMLVCPGGYNSKLEDLDRFYRRHGFVPREDGAYVWDGAGLSETPRCSSEARR